MLYAFFHGGAHESIYIKYIAGAMCFFSMEMHKKVFRKCFKWKLAKFLLL